MKRKSRPETIAAIQNAARAARNSHVSYHLADTMPTGEHYYTEAGTWALDRGERGLCNYQTALHLACTIKGPSGRAPRIVAKV